MVACLETSLHAMNGRNHSLQIECNEYPLHAIVSQLFIAFRMQGNVVACNESLQMRSA